MNCAITQKTVTINTWELSAVYLRDGNFWHTLYTDTVCYPVSF